MLNTINGLDLVLVLLLGIFILRNRHLDRECNRHVQEIMDLCRSNDYLVDYATELEQDLKANKDPGMEDWFPIEDVWDSPVPF